MRQIKTKNKMLFAGLCDGPCSRVIRYIWIPEAKPAFQDPNTMQTTPWCLEIVSKSPSHSNPVGWQ